MPANPNAPLYRVLVPGGVLSVSELLRVIDLAADLGLDGLHFGSRQDILLPVDRNPTHVLPRYPDLELEPLAAGRSANIVSSYVAADIFPTTAWLTSATYLYVLDRFQDSHRLEINIVDPRQRLVPPFTGHLNFIASAEEDYWYLYVRLPGWAEAVALPTLIYSWDLATVSRLIEDEMDTIADEAGVLAAIRRDQSLNLRNVEQDLTIPFYPFPFYEGMNRIDGKSYWLGLYWRNNWYDLAFLRAVCQLALEHRIGKFCITPWKSFVLVGIPDARRLDWEKLLGRFGINARHSSLELNWHIPVGDAAALELKRYLVREFDRRDISTYGLTIGIASHYGQPFTSILITEDRAASAVDGLLVRPTYTLQYARGFDPNNREYVEYACRVDRSELTELMIELSQHYFEQLNVGADIRIKATASEPVTAATADLHACAHCSTVYDPVYGDEARGVAPGTPFEALPEDYRCWTCGTPVRRAEAV